MVYSGTQILLSSGPSSLSLPQKCIASREEMITVARTAAIGVVVKTGFETKQGKLVRTIIHSQARVSQNSGEAFAFILFLLVFALAASGYVLKRGLADPLRSRWKLVLTCSQIITSVVPPELPMELSLAVNTSLIALHKLSVFCTEPFRIPFAGKITTCCFDKTGTLTTDEMLFGGVDLCDAKGFRPSNLPAGSAPVGFPLDTEQVLASCHSLVVLGTNEIAGDAMEKAAMTAIKWQCTKSDVVSKTDERSSRTRTITILSRFPFDPSVRRMSCVVADCDDRIVVCKGAPEAIKPLLQFCPANYDEVCAKYTAAGHRVIALARRVLGDDHRSKSAIFSMKRQEAESNLVFAGFAVFVCPLKKDAADTIRILQGGSNFCCIITGDSLATAVAVGRQVGIVDSTKEVAIASSARPDCGPLWVAEKGGMVLTAKELSTRVLCVNGETMPPDAFQTVVQAHGDAVAVWARCAPEQKEIIVMHLKTLGRFVLMAGDGTNDVGGLKQAHVGIAVLNSSSLLTGAAAAAAQSSGAALSATTTPNGAACPIQVSAMPAPLPPNAGFMERMKYEIAVARRKAEIAHKERWEQAQLKHKEAVKVAAAEAAKGAPPPPPKLPNSMEDLLGIGGSSFNDMDDMTSAPIIKLGDASIAAPFTCKSKRMTSICDIVRLGRCTLATTLQMYKILALNCLISAYSMSVLHSDGVKFGDKQMTLSGIVIAVCFLFLTRSKPLDALSKEKPISRVFHPYIIVSILGQFAFHLWALMSSVNIVKAVDPEAVALQRGEVDKLDFRPTLLNSIVFLMTTMMTVLTFALNYRGRPFMVGLSENKPMFFGLLILGGITVLCAMEYDRSLNELLEIVPFPSDEFRASFLWILFVDVCGAFAMERIAKFALGWMP